MDDFGTFICNMISRLAAVLPDHPSNLSLSALATQLASNAPFIGAGLIYSLMRDISEVLGLVLAVKLYKLLPFI